MNDGWRAKRTCLVFFLYVMFRLIITREIDGFAVLNGFFWTVLMFDQSVNVS